MQPNVPNSVPDQPVAAMPPALPAIPAPYDQALSTSQNSNAASALASAAPTSAATPSAADDGDMIEKEWVVKAKQVLTSSADDPYQQNIAFTQLRADYMKKRYGKDLKVDS